MRKELDNLFDDFGDGDAPSESSDLEKRIEKIENAIGVLVKEVANATKKKYPYPEGYPKPDEEDSAKKKKEEEDKEEELTLAKETLASKEAELIASTEKLAEYESKEKSEQINELVNSELDKKLYSEEQSVDVAKEYQKLDLSAIEILKKRLTTIDLSLADKKTNKSKELKAADEEEKATKLKDLNERISAREEAGLKTKDLDKELAELTKE